MSNIIVTYSSSEIRRIARAGLRGHWVKVALGLCIFTLMQSIPLYILQSLLKEKMLSAVNYPMQFDMSAIIMPMMIITAYVLVVSGPLSLGLYMFLLNYLRTRTLKYDLLLSGFAYLGRAIGLTLIITLILLFSALLFIIPAIILSIAYSMCFYIMADNLNIGIIETIRRSWRMMSGNKFKLFCLYVSFIGWLLLTSLVLCIVDVIAVAIGVYFPFMTMTFAVIMSVIGALVVVPINTYLTISATLFYEMVSGRIPPGPGYIPIAGPGQYWQGPPRDFNHGQWGPPPTYLGGPPPSYFGGQPPANPDGPPPTDPGGPPPSYPDVPPPPHPDVPHDQTDQGHEQEPNDQGIFK